MLGWFEEVDIYEIFLRKRLREIIKSRRDLKLVMERNVKIGGKTRVFRDQMFHFLWRMISSI